MRAALLFLSIFFFPLAAIAQQAVPALTGAVVDLPGLLPVDERGKLSGELEAFAHAHGSQIVVLIVSSTKPEALEEYSMRVAETWKIGREKISDGAILLIAKDDHAMRIEVGQGLEGAIPDAYAKRIVADIIAPYFRSGHFAEGVLAGVQALEKLILGEKLPPPQWNDVGSAANSSVIVIVFLVVFFAIIVGSILAAKNTKSGGRSGTSWSSGSSGWSVSSGGFSGGGSGGGFSGGGGSFSGGGASGGW